MSWCVEFSANLQPYMPTMKERKCLKSRRGVEDPWNNSLNEKKRKENLQSQQDADWKFLCDPAMIWLISFTCKWFSTTGTSLDLEIHNQMWAYNIFFKDFKQFHLRIRYIENGMSVNKIINHQSSISSKYSLSVYYFHVLIWLLWIAAGGYSIFIALKPRLQAFLTVTIQKNLTLQYWQSTQNIAE